MKGTLYLALSVEETPSVMSSVLLCVSVERFVCHLSSRVWL